MAQTRSTAQAALEKNPPTPVEEAAETVAEEEEAVGNIQYEEEVVDGEDHDLETESNGKAGNQLSLVHETSEGGDETEATAQGTLSLDDAYNILADVGYSGKQNLHGPDAHVSPLPGQVYLFYFPIERHPYKRFKINDGWYWHNKSKIMFPRDNPRIAKVVYRATGWRSPEKIRPENVLHTRKVYWLTAAEENDENAVVLVEYIRDNRRHSSQLGAPSSQSSSSSSKAGQTKRKILVDPPARGTPLSGPSDMPRSRDKRLRQLGNGTQSSSSSQYFRDGKKLNSSPEQQYNYDGSTRDEMLQRVDEALQYVDEFKELLWNVETNLQSVRNDITLMDATRE